MDGASAAFAVVSVVDLCIKYGNLVIERISAYKHASERIGDLYFRIARIWVKTKTQIEALKRTWTLLEYDLRMYHEDALRRLEVRLQCAEVAVSSFASVDRGLDTGGERGLSRIKKLKFSAVEQSLLRIINDLEQWYSYFDPSWLMIALNPNPQLDQHLHATEEAPGAQAITSLRRIREVIHDRPQEFGRPKTVIRSPDFLRSDERMIEHSACSIDMTSSENIRVVVELTNYPTGMSKKLTTQSVCDLARLLAECEPDTIGLLNCLGILKLEDQFKIIYRVPQDVRDLRSLRAMLLLDTVPSIDLRLRISKYLIRSVMAVHTAKFVHKNIRPETVLVFENTDRVSSAFLVGFESFRSAHGDTMLAGDMSWQRNLYRHPERQGQWPDKEHIMQHDIYSLGVCLLELGLWTSFVTYDAQEAMEPSPHKDLEMSLRIDNKKHRINPKQIKNRLVAMTEWLPSRMGNTYTEIVQSCLLCLDEGESNTFSEGVDFDEDERGSVLVGIQYIEKILIKIDGIHLSSDDYSA